jgi:hypothetical protein
MKLTTKYGIKDKVFKISRAYTKKYVECAACGGTGEVTLRNGIRGCPECYGTKGSYLYGSEEWSVVNDTFTIGQVRVYVQNFKKSGFFDNVGTYDKKSGESKKVEYMCYETGIGSGSVHNEETLWPTHEEAQSECYRLNSTKESTESNANEQE